MIFESENGGTCWSVCCSEAQHDFDNNTDNYNSDYRDRGVTLRETEHIYSPLSFFSFIFFLNDITQTDYSNSW